MQCSTNKYKRNYNFISRTFIFPLKDCGSLSNPTNGIVTLPEKTSEGQIAVYKCNVGFTLSDMTLAIRTCLSTGDWSMAAPECIVGEFEFVLYD